MKEENKTQHKMTLDVMSGFRFAWGVFLAIISLALLSIAVMAIAYLIIFIIGGIY